MRSSSTTNNFRSKTQSTERNKIQNKIPNNTTNLKNSKININSIQAKANKLDITKEVKVHNNAPAENIKSNKENVNVNKDILIKKKHITIKSKDNNEKSNLTSLKSKFDELYRKFNSNEGNSSSWKKMFHDLFEKEKIIDFSSETFIPRSLDKTGSTILKLDKVWVLWMEIVKNDINLTKLVNLANEALNYLSDEKLIRTRFNSIFNFLKVSKKELKEFTASQNININNKHIGEFDYLLDRNACQSNKKNLKTNYNKISSSKSKKLSTPESSLQFKIDSINKILSEQKGLLEHKEFKDGNQILTAENIKPLNYNSETNIQVKTVVKENYEASYMTINESINEDTINNTSKIIITDKKEKESDKKANSIRIMTPEVCTYVETIQDGKIPIVASNIFTLAKEQNLLDRKSIVEDIENLTLTLKKEVEQLSTIKIEDPQFHIEKKEECLLSDECECQLHNRKKSISPILLRKSCAPQINFDNENLLINHNETENTLNQLNIDEAINITNFQKENSIVEENIPIVKELTPEKEHEKVIDKREDSYEKYLREKAEIRGENIEELISYNKIVPVDVNCLDDDEENLEQNYKEEDDALNQTDEVIPNLEPELDQELSDLRRRLTENRNNRMRSKNKKKRKTKSKKRQNK
jgi:hypothetical protein